MALLPRKARNWLKFDASNAKNIWGRQLAAPFTEVSLWGFLTA